VAWAGSAAALAPGHGSSTTAGLPPAATCSSAARHIREIDRRVRDEGWIGNAVGHSPVLTILDAAITQLQLDSYATVAIARYE
jgi:hypothetical protein